MSSMTSSVSMSVGRMSSLLGRCVCRTAGSVLRLQVTVHQVDLLEPAETLADVLRADLPHALHRFQLGIGGGEDLVKPAELADDVLDHQLRKPGNPAQDAVAAGRDGIVEGVDLAVVPQKFGQAPQVEQVLVGEAGDAIERGGEGLVGG